MPNGKYILNDLEFDKQIKEMDDRELMEFSARLGYSNAIRISSIESQRKRTIGLTGGLGVFIGGIIIGIVEYFRSR